MLIRRGIVCWGLWTLAAWAATTNNVEPETHPAIIPSPPAVARAPAPDDELQTDRPGFTESPNTVRPNWYQVEAGFGASWESQRDGHLRSVMLPLPLFRLGLTDRLELRVAAEGYGNSRFRGAQGQTLARGLSDFELGLKYLVWPETDWLPQFAVIASVNEPYGHPAFTSGSVDSRFKLCWAKNLPGGWESSGNLNVFSLQQDGQRFVERDVTLSFGHELGWGFKGYVETYRLMAINLARENLNIVQSGWARPLGRRWQLDLSVARSYAGGLPQWSLSGGVTFKAPFLDGQRMRRH